DRNVERTFGSLSAVTRRLADRRGEMAGLCVTGQQHGVVVADGALHPATSLINWQDRRCEEPFPGLDVTYVEHAVALAGPDAPRRTGCRMAAGWMGATLFWMRTNEVLPPSGTACFIMDFFRSALTGQAPVTDPTNAAASGLFDVSRRTWDDAIVEALGIPKALLPEIVETGQASWTVSAAAASRTGLPEGLPVFVGMGDNQASFLGSVADRGRSVLVNVGTGAQVSAYTETFVYAPPLETRPFPMGGYLLTYAGLCGGRSYALLEGFFRAVGREILGVEVRESVYEAMNALALSVADGADGLGCEPLFAGSRENPELRGTLTGMSTENFTPAHLTRALLEGLADELYDHFDRIQAAAGKTYDRLTGAGNGLRKNSVLTGLVAKRFAMPLTFPRHREEAALGAALVAGVGSGALPDLDAAGRLLTGD
ncbi:MAG: hypothetical protein QG656_754, partial [Candidatus Hydrogenedentes bacterium]|nr:hypothetical protein [Candidatus Hydrogenedentota bacterium]